ncbi:MAG TPA: hypothetical protein VGE52_02755 [Pirellulales bacterium]
MSPALALMLLLAVAAADPQAKSDSERTAQQAGVRRTLQYAPAPIDNPLKGLMPWAGDFDEAFPHSLEYHYFSLAEVMPGANEFDWEKLDAALDAIAARGHQAVIRPSLEEPGRADFIPAFLKQGGLKVHEYTIAKHPELKQLATPDYADPKLRAALTDFIAAFGKKYDGDPRVGFVTAGLLGYWGEWHTYPRNDLFAPKETQIAVMDAYEKAFVKTAVVVRRPMGERDANYAPNAQRRLGYHDDLFAFETLSRSPGEPAWFFESLLTRAGEAATTKWKTRPIGGEVAPQIQSRLFDAQPGPDVQSFRECVEATHATWLIDHQFFSGRPSAEAIANATREVRRMGYELHVIAATIASPVDHNIHLTLEISSRGVAPFYYDWPIEIGLLPIKDGRRSAQAAYTHRLNEKLSELVPADAPYRWTTQLNVAEVPAQNYVAAIRIPNPLPEGRPLRFANAEQEHTGECWLPLGPVTVEK